MLPRFPLKQSLADDFIFQRNGWIYGKFRAKRGELVLCHWFLVRDCPPYSPRHKHGERRGSNQDFFLWRCMNPATMQPSRRNFNHTFRRLRSCSHSLHVIQSDVGIFNPAFFKSAIKWCVPYGSYIFFESRRWRQEAMATSATCARVANCAAAFPAPVGCAVVLLITRAN